ncbi:YraN family protein [uncultured Maricaulis sp.]|uniref:YraN family protein n=1 Tax=uncultured Maricaulis sp. TaxID=174710 RepID=UPI0030DBDDC8
MTRARRQAEARGRWAEWLAIAWLTLKGYRVLDHRARTAAGEIDLVARRGEYLVFIEVKARPTIEGALDSIGPRQRGRITRAASIWRASRPALHDLHLRYDLVLVVPGRWPQHRRAAWIPGDRARDLL